MDKIYLFNEDKNFARVLKAPKQYPTEYCNPAIPVTFMMVDWFIPCFKKMNVKDEYFEDYEYAINVNLLEESLIQFIENKNYIELHNKFIVICDFGYTFSFET